jgi:hypothetical protein
MRPQHQRHLLCCCLKHRRRLHHSLHQHFLGFVPLIFQQLHHFLLTHQLLQHHRRRLHQRNKLNHQ